MSGSDISKSSITQKEIWNILETEFVIDPKIKEILSPFLKGGDEFKSMLRGMVFLIEVMRDSNLCSEFSYNTVMNKIERIIAQGKIITRACNSNVE